MQHKRLMMILIVGLVMSLGFETKCSAVDLFDSITGEQTPYQAFSLSLSISSASDAFAQQFNSSAATVIDSLALVIAQNGSSTGSIDLAIYSTSGTNTPATQVGGTTTINVAALPAAVNNGGVLEISSSPQVYTGLNTTIASGDYFVVLSNFTGSGTIYWASWTGTSKTGTLETQYFDGGWQSLGSTNPFLLTVSTAAVPEPSTWALMTIATGTIAGLSHRRRKAAKI